MHILVLPYPVKDMEYYMDYYDEIMLPLDGSTHFKSAITKRNQWMIDNSDLLISYVDHESGGAYQGFKRAKANGIQIINIADTI